MKAAIGAIGNSDTCLIVEKDVIYLMAAVEGNIILMNHWPHKEGYTVRVMIDTIGKTTCDL